MSKVAGAFTRIDLRIYFEYYENTISEVLRDQISNPNEFSYYYSLFEKTLGFLLKLMKESWSANQLIDKISPDSIAILPDTNLKFIEPIK